MAHLHAGIGQCRPAPPTCETMIARCARVHVSTGCRPCWMQRETSFYSDRDAACSRARVCCPALRPSVGLLESETLVHAAEDDTWKLNPMHACLGSTRTA